jgi:hypothetical protein
VSILVASGAGADPLRPSWLDIVSAKPPTPPDIVPACDIRVHNRVLEVIDAPADSKSPASAEARAQVALRFLIRKHSLADLPRLAAVKPVQI